MEERVEKLMHILAEESKSREQAEEIVSSQALSDYLIYDVLAAAPTGKRAAAFFVKPRL